MPLAGPGGIIKRMTRGILSLLLLVGLLFVAFIFREFTAPWQVGRELEQHRGKLSELEGGVAQNQELSTSNREEILKNRKAITRHEGAIKENRNDIQAARSELEQLAADNTRRMGELETSTRELKELYEKTVQTNGNLEREVLRLKENGRVLEGRLTAIEEKLGITAPGPGDIQ